MFWIKVLANGALELVLAAFMLTATLLANDGARLGMPALLAVDVLAAMAVAITGWRPAWGAGVTMVVAVSGLIVDSEQFGIWTITLMCAVISLMRTRHWRLFTVTFTVVFVCSVAATYRSNAALPGAFWDALFTWGAYDGFMLIVGLGLYSAARHSEEAEAERSRAVRLQAAVDLHDLVARDLTALVADAERARMRGGADAELLGAMAERARSAGAALRGTVGYLTAKSGTSGGATTSFVEALAAGSARLNRARMRGEREGDLNPVLPPDVDAAAGRILGEVLFNILQHGKARGSWQLSAERTADTFDFTVTNERGVANDSVVAGMGSVGIEQFARSVGGLVEQTYTEDHWTCSVSLPLEGGCE